MSENEPNEKIVPVPMEPIHVAVMTSTGTGAGGEKQQLVETPEGHRDIVINYVSPIVGLGVSAAMIFLTSWVGLMTAGPMTGQLTAPDFWQLAEKCASLSVGVTVVGTAKDVITLLAKLKEKFPILGAS